MVRACVHAFVRSRRSLSVCVTACVQRARERKISKVSGVIRSTHTHTHTHTHSNLMSMGATFGAPHWPAADTSPNWSALSTGGPSWTDSAVGLCFF